MNNKELEHFSPSVKHEQVMRWGLLAIIVASIVVIAPNTSDSTLLKPAILVVGSFAILMFWLGQVMKSEKFHCSFSITEIIFIIYIIISGLSLLLAINSQLGWEALAQLICLLIIFMVSRRYIPDSKAIHQTLNIILGTTLICCIVALIQIYQLAPFMTLLTSTERQAISTFGNATFFAGFLVLTLPLVISRAVNERNASPKQFILFFFAGVIIYLLMKTQTRSAWVAVLISLITFGILYFSSRRAKAGYVAGALVLTGIVALIFPDIVYHRLSGLFEMSPTSSISRRLFFYDGAWKAFLASPFLGNGIGNFTVFLPKFRLPDYWMFRSEDIVPHAHNELLEILAETGILGFFAFAALLVFLWINLRKNLKEKSGNDRVMMIGLVCGLLGVFIDNLASMNLRTVPIAACFWGLMGMSLGPSSIRNFSVSMPLPAIIMKLRFVPYIILVVFIFWYAQLTLSRYQAEKHFLEGNMLNNENDRSAASVKFAEALSNNPHHALARFYSGANFIKSSDYGSARAHIDTLLREFPYYPKAHLMLALSSFELGDTATAAVEINNEIAIDKSPQTLFIASYFAYRLNKKEQELQTILILLEQNMKSGIGDYAPQGINRLTALCDSQSFQTTYRGLISDLQQKFNSDPAILTAIGECYVGFGLMNEARLAVGGALKLHPDNPTLVQKLHELKRTIDEQNGVKR